MKHKKLQMQTEIFVLFTGFIILLEGFGVTSYILGISIFTFVILDTGLIDILFKRKDDKRSVIRKKSISVKRGKNKITRRNPSYWSFSNYVKLLVKKKNDKIQKTYTKQNKKKD